MPYIDRDYQRNAILAVQKGTGGGPARALGRDGDRHRQDDLYSALKDVTDMKPVVVNPFTSFEQLVKEAVVKEVVSRARPRAHCEPGT